MGAGLALGAGGSVLDYFGKKSQAKKQTALQREAAGQVKLDYPGEIGVALGDIERFLPQAGAAAGRVGAADQDILDLLREKAAPGTRNRRDKMLEIIDSYLRGELSPETQRGISRSSAARGAARYGSLGGSIPLRAEAAALGRGVEQQQAQGFNLLGAFQSLYPMAQAPSTASFLGGTPQQRLGMRAQEQSTLASILSGIQAPPSIGQSLGPMMQGIGGVATGVGAAYGLNQWMGGSGVGGGAGQSTDAWRASQFSNRW